MKYINRISIIVLLAAIVACEVQNSDILVGGDGDADLSGQQYANINPATRVNFVYQATSGIEINLLKFEAEGSAISSVEVTKTLRIADVIDADDTVVGFTSAPVTYTVTGDVFSQTLAELFADVPVEGNIWVEDSLDPGDSWLLEYKLNLTGNAPTADAVLDIATTTFIPFACLSEIPAGSYTSTIGGGAFGVVTTNPDVTLTALDSDGNYSLSDLTSGVFPDLGGSSFNFNQPGTINDLCNNISVSGNAGSQINLIQDAAAGPGSWDAATSTMVVNWFDATNSFAGISILTPN